MAASGQDRHPYEPEIQVGVHNSEKSVIIEISDNGTGMDQKTREQAFEPLFTTRARGTGLGLANVQKIVKEHKGSVRLSSVMGEGTTVKIELPVAETLSD